jgi:predicted phage terminase large subunit-like protein
MRDLNESEQRAVEQLFGLFARPRLRFCPLTPTARQEAFLMLTCREVFFGGAAGGGKSAALLMAGLQYADVPSYHALLLRRTLSELNLPGNLLELSHDWLAQTNAVWNGEQKQWRFPGRGRTGSGGGTLTFGYLADDNDLGRYAGSSFSFLGFDELTRFPEQHYRRMQRVLRQPTIGETAADGTSIADVPARIRSASNPGSEHHEWVKTRFVNPDTRAEGVVFLPSRLTDNPHLDLDAYTATLAQFPPAERERLLYGNWNVPDDGELFQRHWFTPIEPQQLPAKTVAVRYWDLAATEPSTANPDPDWTVGLRLDFDPTSGVFYIRDIVRVRKSAGSIERLVQATAERDGRTVTVVIEEEPGGAGKAVTGRYKAQVLRGFTVRSHRPTGEKYVRAQPVSAAAENNLVRLVTGIHSQAFLDELTSFPHGRHDDCVDALAGAHHHVAKLPRRPATTSYPTGRIPPVSQIATRSMRSGVDPIDQIAATLGARVYRS